VGDVLCVTTCEGRHCLAPLAVGETCRFLCRATAEEDFEWPCAAGLACGAGDRCE
jgi:hypothetical protein